MPRLLIRHSKTTIWEKKDSVIIGQVELKITSLAIHDALSYTALEAWLCIEHAAFPAFKAPA